MASKPAVLGRPPTLDVVRCGEGGEHPADESHEAEDADDETLSVAGDGEQKEQHDQDCVEHSSLQT